MTASPPRRTRFARLRRSLVLASGVAVGTLLVVLSLAFAGTSRARSSGESLVLVDQPFRCEQYRQPLDIGLLKVTLSPGFDGSVEDAVNLNRGECTGEIDRLEVDTWSADGVKVGPTAHDLTVRSGYVYCHGHTPLAHQDGIQAMGGRAVTFANLHVYCPTSNNASFFVGAGREATDSPADWPQEIVCENCQLDGGASTAFIGRSVRSGLRGSLVHEGHYRAIRIGAAVDAVLDDVVTLPCSAACGSS